jgi:hypothetical protein
VLGCEGDLPTGGVAADSVDDADLAALAGPLDLEVLLQGRQVRAGGGTSAVALDGQGDAVALMDLAAVEAGAQVRERGRRAGRDGEEQQCREDVTGAGRQGRRTCRRLQGWRR